MKSIVFFVLILAMAMAKHLSGKAMNPNMIEAINNTPNVKWTAGVNNRFNDATLRQIANLCGVLPSSGLHQEKAVDTVAASIPDSFDARENWPQCPIIGKVWDQADCGSCWAFGATEAWSDRLCIGTDGAFQLPLSTADLTSCCGWSCGQGCNGGELPGAWSYIKKNGLVTGGLNLETDTCYPYPLASCDHHVNGTRPPCGNTVPTPKCQKSCQAGYPLNFDADKHKASKVYPISSKVDAIQTEIMTHGPIEAAFSVYADFPLYKSGVYHHVSGSYLGGHAIKILGWGVEDGTAYWLVANSWNEDWGNKGYFRILRGSNECGIEADGYAGVL
jgi:cathepsin B